MHRFRGIEQYAQQFMDLAEGKPVFTGRGKKPSNKAVLAAIASIEKCKHGSFLRIQRRSRVRVVGIPKQPPEEGKAGSQLLPLRVRKPLPALLTTL